MNLKNNWFKISVIIILIFICYLVYKYIDLNTQKDLAQNQEKCREAGVVEDKKESDGYTDFRFSPSFFSSGYYYNPKLNTCLQAYTFRYTKDTTYLIKDDEERMGFAIKDLYNNWDILRCEDYFCPSHGVSDDIVITKNLNGIAIDSKENIVIKENNNDWTQCGKYTAELTGGKFVAGDHF